MVNWSELQTDLLGLIARRFTVAADRVRFSGVCQNWYSVAQSESNYLPCNPPWLMLTEKSDGDSRLRGFAGLMEASASAGKETFDLELPIAKGTRCAGSTGCWLVMVDLDFNMYILNPYTGTKIDLPPFSAFDEFKDFCEQNPHWESNVDRRDNFISEKVILSFPNFKSPAEDDFVAVAIIDGKQKKSLAYTTKGAKSWETIEEGDTKSWKNRPNVCLGFYDVTFYQGKFYAVNGLGSVFEFSISFGPNDHKPKLEPISDSLKGPSDRRYLVEFQGMLLQVLKFVKFDDEGKPIAEIEEYADYRTKTCEVFKLDFLTGGWEELNDLGQHSIFVGYNTPVSLLASSTSSFKPNCIYFTDDFRMGYLDSPFLGGRDMGVFNFGDRTIEPHYTGSCSCITKPIYRDWGSQVMMT